MNFYEKLPNEILIAFYNEINKNMNNGVSTKKMYYELGLIFSIMCRRGIILTRFIDYKEDDVSTQSLKNYSA